MHEEAFGFNTESQITNQSRVETLVPHLRLVGLTQHRHAECPKHNILTSVFGCPKPHHKAPEKGSGCPSHVWIEATHQQLFIEGRFDLFCHALHLKHTPSN